MEVYLHPKVIRYLDTLDNGIADDIKKKLKEVEEHGIFSGRFDVKKLEGTSDREDPYRLRIGDYRALFGIDGKKILITKIFHRSQGDF